MRFHVKVRLGEKFVLKRQSFTEWEAENGVDAAADGAGDEVLIPEWSQVVEALSTRRKGRRLKFAAHEMK